MSLGYISGTLPSEWETPFLVDLVSPKQWKTIPTKELTDDGYIVYGANGKIGFYNKYTHESATLMITCRGATCGNLHISEPLSYINGNAMALDNRPTNYLNIKYLKYSLQARGLQDTISGSAQPQITKQGLEKVQIPLPPLAEQKIIAEKLDILLAQVDSTKARLEQIPQILKRFRQAILAAAISGKLTESWRNEQGTNFSKWENTFFENICTEITVGYVGKMLDRYQSEGIPFLRSQNVREFKFSDKNLLYITESFHKEIFKSRLTPGDLAIVRSGAPGTTCVIPNSLPVANCSDLVIARPSEKLNSSFGCIFMNSNVAKANVSENRVGIAQQHFNVGSMKKMPIHLPPISEQQEIVRRVEQLFAYADTIEKQVNNALTRVNNLTQSILLKTFRGELTTQWRAENPDLISGENSAAALLEKIKSERADSSSKKVSRKKA
ncbi:restriction endonuclease subunit S [Proteus terrae]|uniref:restriction endonuclease subunit S n=1 Tax=Proteus terrae TaxID=1574161 RepID=UPI000D696B48|nr:restriction endonuclease subunit S [Proteus terrae]